MWAAPVDCEPGFFCDVIKLIGNMAQVKPYMSDVILIIDAWPQMDLKKTWYVGWADYGTGLPEAEDDLETGALVYMICCLLVTENTQLLTSLKNIQH